MSFVVKVKFAQYVYFPNTFSRSGSLLVSSFYWICWNLCKNHVMKLPLWCLQCLKIKGTLRWGISVGQMLMSTVSRFCRSRAIF